MASGDDIKAGRGTSASNPTVLLASNDDDGNAGFTLPCAVVEAGPTDTESDVPQSPFAGVMGRGSHGLRSDSSNDMLPMPGLLGYGGMPSSRQGGAGVTGVGGSDDFAFPGPALSRNPGPGVFGVGGFTDIPPAPRFGAGVVGVSGSRVHDSDMPEPPNPVITLNTGVVGSSTVGVGVAGFGTTAGVTGAGSAGAGVSGFGNTGGVVGTSTATVTPVNSLTVAGVVGNGRLAPGVIGTSGADRGGVFTSALRGTPMAQMRLIPHAAVHVLATGTLPKKGLPGDLFVREVIVGEGAAVQKRAELWFCVDGDGKATATWGRVQFDDVQIA